MALAGTANACIGNGAILAADQAAVVARVDNGRLNEDGADRRRGGGPECGRGREWRGGRRLPPRPDR